MNRAMKFLAGSSLLAALMAVTLVIRPANGAGQESVPLHQDHAVWDKSWRSGDPIEGVWNVSVVITDCASGNPLGPPPFDAMAMFNANGTFQDTNSNSPTLQVRSDAFGYWEHTRGKKYRFAFKAFHFDLAGMYIGYNIVRHTVVLAKNGKSYTSRGTVEFFSPDGTTRPPVLGCSEATATPFK
jgi:hypothetical protein